MQQVLLVHRVQVVRLASLESVDVLEPLEHRDRVVIPGCLDHKEVLGIQVPWGLREELVQLVCQVLQGAVVLQDH